MSEQGAIERHAPAALTALYRHIANTASIRGMFTSQACMNHARDRQVEHWRKLFSGPIDHDDAAAATNIGNVHARMLEHVLPRQVLGRLGLPFGARAASALVKASLNDMDIALAAYFTAEQAGSARSANWCRASPRRRHSSRSGCNRSIPPCRKWTM